MPFSAQVSAKWVHAPARGATATPLLTNISVPQDVALCCFSQPSAQLPEPFTTPVDNREYFFALQDLTCEWPHPLG